jgi:DNA-binding phage protein
MPPPIDVNDVGSNIRAEMGRRRVNMVELARRTGISRTTLHSQINNTRVTVDTLVAVATALGVEVCDLLPAADPAVSA